MSLVLALFGALRAALRTRTDLALENLALRQQLALLRRRSKRPQFGALDRLFWMWLSEPILYGRKLGADRRNVEDRTETTVTVPFVAQRAKRVLAAGHYARWNTMRNWPSGRSGAPGS